MGTKDRPSKTITRLICRPSLEIGGETFPAEQIKEARISFRIDEFMKYRSASVTLNPSAKSRWNYHSEVKLYEEKGVILTGICTEAKYNEEGNLRLALAGPFWKLERTRTRSFETFGMRQRESVYWMMRLASPDRAPVFTGLDLDTSTRPFVYAIPLRGLSEFDKGLLLAGDTGITSKENDSVFNKILEGAESVREVEAWQQDCPRVFGVVIAEDFIQAERSALERANSMVGIVNFALTTGISHFETRYNSEPLQFHAENSFSPVALYPWIAICEAAEPKGWIRHTSPAKLEANKVPDSSLERIQFFLSKFFSAGQPGDIHDQTGRRQFIDREQKLLTSTKRSLHWLNIASQEEDIRDKFTATWTSLESVLNSVEYPGVFDRERAAAKKAIRKGIKEIALPNDPNSQISITTDMLLSRALQNQWPLRTKLSIFADSFGITLEKGDTEMIRKLSRSRNNIFHEGEYDTDVSYEQVRELQHLVERLVAGTSIGGYLDLEGQPHRFQFGDIGPEGGGAPLSIDGKDVDWEVHMFRDSKEKLVAEWIVEGKIYTEEDIYEEDITLKGSAAVPDPQPPPDSQ